MITGAHVILFVPDAEATRAFLRDVIGLPAVDAGEGWLIFALPPAELAAHPTASEAGHELYLMCDDLEATIADLKSRGAEFEGEPSAHAWGVVTRLKVPGGGTLALYEARHASPLTAGRA